MPKKLNSCVGNEIISHVKVIAFAFTFSMLLSNCNNSENRTTNGDTTKTSPVNQPAPQPDTGEKINWLRDPLHRNRWDTIAFSGPDDSLQIEKEKKRIRIYVRGCLAEYNANNPGANYIVEEFSFVRKSSSPLRYTVKAFLNPPARSSNDPGGHLIPPEPDPPGDPEP